MTKNEVKLLSCPFCGEYPDLLQNEGEDGLPPFWVRCSNEDCPLYVDGAFSGNSPEECIYKWNDRYEEKYNPFSTSKRPVGFFQM